MHSLSTPSQPCSLWVWGPNKLPWTGSLTCQLLSPQKSRNSATVSISRLETIMEPPEFTCTVLHVSFWILGGEGMTQAEVL